MEKLVDLLNELAVAEAETEELEAEMNFMLANDKDITEIEEQWDKAYEIQFKKCNEVVERLVQYGIESKLAHKMVITKRSELVKIAGMEA